MSRCASGESSAFTEGRRVVSRNSSSPPATRWYSEDKGVRRGERCGRSGDTCLALPHVSQDLDVACDLFL